MKSIKKLIMASLMLVLAFVGVVASTFAWFTMQNQVDVNDIQLNVGTAGFDLQVSLDGDDATFSYQVDVGGFDGQLIPVTYINAIDDQNAAYGVGGTTYLGNSFQTLDLVSNAYQYTAASPLSVSSLSTESGYIQFDLWFRSSEALTVKLNVTDLEQFLVPLENATQDEIDRAEAARKSLRIMFEHFSFDEVEETYTTLVTRKIYEPFYHSTATYGVGAFFNNANAYLSPVAFDGFVTLDTGTNIFAMKAYYLATEKYTTVSLSDGLAATTGYSGKLFIPVATLPDTVSNKQRVQVTVWIEGWDGDATNDAALAALTTYFQFIGE